MHGIYRAVLCLALVAVASFAFAASPSIRSIGCNCEQCDCQACDCGLSMFRPLAHETVSQHFVGHCAGNTCGVQWVEDKPAAAAPAASCANAVASASASSGGGPLRRVWQNAAERRAQRQANRGR